MAADLLDHNFIMPEDTDADGYVSAIDALAVINSINAKGGSVQLDASVDVDADGALTPLDALFVINFLNRSSESGARQASAVDPESRIFRIELAITEQRLPSSMELGTAHHLLAVLRAGGYPEIGDRILNGELTNDLGMSEVEKITEEEIAKYVSEARMGLGAPIMDARQLSMFADTLMSRLEALGVAGDLSLEVVREVRNSEASSMQIILENVESRLLELNIDVAAVLPERMDVQFNGIVDRLQDVGINIESIIAITNDLRAVYESGTPITDELLQDIITRFGVDGSMLFPSEADRFISDLVEMLGEFGVPGSIISTISSELRNAYASGKPLTSDQIKAGLLELGVSPSTISAIFPNGGDDPWESFVRNLELSGLDGIAIETVVPGIEASIDNGQSLTIAEVVSRLRDLGIEIDSSFPETSLPSIPFAIGRLGIMMGQRS